MYCTVLTNSLLVAGLQHKSAVAIKFNVHNRSKYYYRQSRKLLCFALFPPARLFNFTWIYIITYHITLDWERSVCQGRPSASPKPLDPSKAAHPSRPFCIGDRMRLASLSVNPPLPTFWRKLRHGYYHGCWEAGRGKGGVGGRGRGWRTGMGTNGG